MPFDQPQGGGGGEEPEFFFVAITLAEDVPRGQRIGIIVDGEPLSCAARETIPAGTVVTFIIGQDAMQAYYMLAPNDKRSMSVRRGP